MDADLQQLRDRKLKGSHLVACGVRQHGKLTRREGGVRLSQVQVLRFLWPCTRQGVTVNLPELPPCSDFLHRLLYRVQRSCCICAIWVCEALGLASPAASSGHLDVEAHRHGVVGGAQRQHHARFDCELARQVLHRRPQRLQAYATDSICMLGSGNLRNSMLASTATLLSAGPSVFRHAGCLHNVCCNSNVTVPIGAVIPRMMVLIHKAAQHQ